MNKGEFIKDKLKESGLSISNLAEKLKISRPTIYRWFEDPNLSNDKMIAISEVINYDIGIDFPTMKKKDRKDNFENNDYRLLEKYNNLLEKHNELLQKYYILLNT
jgi:transcriptional regulator with XRE-family HTH domain